MKKSISWFKSLSPIAQLGLGILGTLLIAGVVSGIGGTPSQSTPATPQLKTEVKTETKTEAVAFTTQEVGDATLEQGKVVTRQEGVDGEKTSVYQVIYVEDKEESRRLADASISKEPVPKIIAKGTKAAAPVVATPPPAPKPTASVYYANCTAARAAGAAPVYRGEAGYRAALDRDNDGVGCE
jgi:hypothetical protein